jgi:MFS family permease
VGALKQRDPEKPSSTGRALFFGKYATLAWAAIALVTLGALANRAISTILPAVAEEFDALGVLGIMTTAPMLVYIVAGPTAGVVADSRGGRIVLFSGITAFAGGLLVCALSGGAWVFIVGRVLTGVGEAAFDVSLVVLIASRIPEELRPKLFAAYSTAWLLPSVLGPQAAGLVSGALSWRWVFGGLLLFVILAAVLLARSLRSPSVSAATDGGESSPDRVPLRYAWVAMVGGCGIASISWLRDSFGLSGISSAVLGIAMSVVALGACLRLSPSGVVRFRKGLPAIIGLTAVCGVVFELATAYLPLYINFGFGAPLGFGGAFLAVTGIFWTVGSWLQGSDWVQQRTTTAQRVLIGFMFLAIGIGGVGAIAVGLPLPAAYVVWAIAGIGVGLTNSTLTTARVNTAPQSSQGSLTAATNLLVSCGTSSTVMLIGLSLNGVGSDDVLTGGGIVAGLTAVVCVGGAVASRRVRGEEREAQ